MTSRNNDIANELREIIPGAEWPGLTPTMGDVPAGYFEQLPAHIMQKIHAEEIQDELNNLSPLLADVPKTVPLSAPAGYFEQLSTQILRKIAVQEELENISPLLSDINKTATLSIPAGYFEQLPTQVLQKIAVQEELENISPLLAGASKELPLSVPAGYFEQFPVNVLSAVKTAKVVPMRTYLKWATAACLIAMISAGTLFYMQPGQQVVTPAGNDNILADVSDQAIVDYLQTHMDAFDREELLSIASVNGETLTVPLPETSEMSAEAIQNYLENTGLLKENSTEN